MHRLPNAGWNSGERH